MTSFALDEINVQCVPLTDDDKFSLAYKPSKSDWVGEDLECFITRTSKGESFDIWLLRSF